MAEVDGVWCLRIGEAGHVKTKQRKRRVPVPRAVLGELLALRGDGGKRPLWSRPDTAAASKRLNRGIRLTGIKDERVTFHSLRHLHADACRAVGMRPEVADAIHGHSSGNVSARYGSGYPVEVLAEAVEKAAEWLALRVKRCKGELTLIPPG